MNIVLISDTHGHHNKLQLPDGDVLIHSGDFTSVGNFYQIFDFLEWFKSQKHKYKILIAGNHDKGIDEDLYNRILPNDGFPVQHTRKIPIKKALENFNSLSNCFYLENSECIIENIKFFGSPYTPWFHGEYWAFNKHRGDDINQIWELIPNDTNVLITHGPPYGHLDQCDGNSLNLGCEMLIQRIEQLPNLKLHTFGHIHPGYGQKISKDRIFVNASICDDNNYPINKPIVINI